MIVRYYCKGVNYRDSDSAVYYCDNNSAIYSEVLTGVLGGQVALPYAYSEVNILIFRLWYRLTVLRV